MTGLLKSVGTGKGINAPGRFPWEGCNNHLKDHLKVVSWRKSITVLLLSSQGKPTWQHFYRYLCEGCINPQNQSILLQMIFLRLSIDLTIFSGHSGKRTFFLLRQNKQKSPQTCWFSECRRLLLCS